MKRSIVMLIVVVATGALLLECCAIVIDPFYRFDLISIPDFNAQRPMFAYFNRMAKAESICRVRPGQIVIGGSKIEVAMDVRSWGNAYNAGMAGMPLSEMAATLQFVARNAPLQRAVIGLDFLMFNQLRENVVYKTEVVDFSADRISGDCLRAFAVDWNFLLGPKALNYALNTIRDQRDPIGGGNVGISRLIPARGVDSWEYFAILFDDDGFRSQFPIAYSDGRNGFGNFGQEQYYIEKIWRPAPRHAYEFGRTVQTLAAMNAFATSHGIDVRYFLEPVHANMLLAIDEAGLWPKFEEMKRKIVAIAPVWDFGLDSQTEDENNYWESSHYKKQLGGMVLERVLDGTAEDFGILLTRDNIEAWLAAQRDELAAYRTLHPKLTAAMAAMVKTAIARTPESK